MKNGGTQKSPHGKMVKTVMALGVEREVGSRIPVLI